MCHFFVHEYNFDLLLVPKYYNFTTFWKKLLVIIKLWFCTAFCWRHITVYLGISALSSRSISLLACDRASLFLFMVFMFSPNILKSSAYVRSTGLTHFRCFPHFFWTSSVTYAKGVLERSGYKSSPCFRSLWIGIASDFACAVFSVGFV
jgi:hypothetical protein